MMKTDDINVGSPEFFQYLYYSETRQSKQGICIVWCSAKRSQFITQHDFNLVKYWMCSVSESYEEQDQTAAV